MPVTSPDNIYFSDTSAPADVNAISSSEATSVQAALALRQRFEFVWASAAARTAQTGMTGGSTGYQIDTKAEYIYESSIWRLKTPYAEFTSASTASTAGSVYTAAGALTINTSLSTSTTFATSSANVITLADPGIYSLSAYCVTSTAGSWFAMFGNASDATTNFNSQVSRQGTSNDNALMLSLPLFRSATSNQIINFWFHPNAGYTASMSAVVKVARVG